MSQFSLNGLSTYELYDMGVNFAYVHGTDFSPSDNFQKGSRRSFVAWAGAHSKLDAAHRRK